MNVLYATGSETGVHACAAGTQASPAHLAPAATAPPHHPRRALLLLPGLRLRLLSPRPAEVAQVHLEPLRLELLTAEGARGFRGHDVATVVHLEDGVRRQHDVRALQLLLRKRVGAVRAVVQHDVDAPCKLAIRLTCSPRTAATTHWQEELSSGCPARLLMRHRPGSHESVARCSTSFHSTVGGGVACRNGMMGREFCGGETMRLWWSGDGCVSVHHLRCVIVNVNADDVHAHLEPCTGGSPVATASLQQPGSPPESCC